jgi:hypothetical protein
MQISRERVVPFRVKEDLSGDNALGDIIRRKKDMKDKETLHRKVQELVDCFATSDPLREMSMLKNEEAEEEAPLKWLAFSVLHGINAGAKEISVVKSADGGVRVFAEYWKAELPTPGSTIGEGIFEALRRISHLEGDEGKTDLAMGVRDGSVDLGLRIERDENREKITLRFPETYERGAEGVQKEEQKKGNLAEQGMAKNLDYCRFAADPEHQRAYREEEPCDDARTGDYEKRIGDEKK